MFHARNLFVLETMEMSAEIHRLVRATRREGGAPEVEILLKKAGDTVRALLAPISKEQMVAILPPESDYVKTRNRNACPLVGRFEAGRRRMMAGRTGFGNPLRDLCEVWEVPDLAALNKFFLCVRHLLMHVLLEAQDLKDLYSDTREKLLYLSTVGVSIEPLKTPADESSLSLDLFDNSGAVGWPVIRAVQLEAIEDPFLALLHQALNNPSITLQWRMMEGGWDKEHADALVAWETHYGAMWGPFQ